MHHLMIIVTMIGTFAFRQPARLAQLVRALDLKTGGCGFDSRAGQPNNY